MTVLYEGKYITVCIKELSISSEDVPGGMPQLLRAHWGVPDAYVGVVHRLDVGTSGVMVYARTPAAAAGLSRQIADSQQQPDAAPVFRKEYRAVIAGEPDETLAPAGTLQDLLFKDSRKGKVFVVSRPRKGVRSAALDYTVEASAALPEGGACSLVSVVLHTGRTHQIRVQFASRRHPLWGDGKYGSRQKGTLALQCARLCFLHPVTGQAMDFSVPMPQGMPWDLFR